MSGLFRGGLRGFGGRGFGGRGARPGTGSADIRPREKGPIAWELPEPSLFGLDGRRDLLLRLDASLVNRGSRPVTLREAAVGGAEPAWDAPRAEWYENGSVRRAVFRVEPWLPLTLAPAERKTQARLLFVVPRSAAPKRGTARLPLVLRGEPFGELRFEVQAPLQPLEP